MSKSGLAVCYSNVTPRGRTAGVQLRSCSADQSETLCRHTDAPFDPRWQRAADEADTAAADLKDSAEWRYNQHARDLPGTAGRQSSNGCKITPTSAGTVSE